MMNKAVFLDRDGTINVEKHYLYKVEDFEFLHNSIEALKMLKEAGFLLFIMTNQSGIGRGYYSENDFKKLNNWMLCELEKAGIHIEKVYYCPHFPGSQIRKYDLICKCRKPNLGMFQDAINEYDLNVSNSFAIGDKLRDLEICKTWGCKGYLVEKSEDMDVISDVLNGSLDNISYKRNLYEAANEIVKIYSNKESR